MSERLKIVVHTIWIRLKFQALDLVEDQKARLATQMTTIQGCNDQICKKTKNGQDHSSKQRNNFLRSNYM